MIEMPRSIAAINFLPSPEKRSIYFRFIPSILLERFNISPEMKDPEGKDLFRLRAESGSTDVVLELRDEVKAEDPILYAHLTDTINGQIHVLLYVINDPDCERFDVDRMPDGTPTHFGMDLRNLSEEIRAMKAGLAPGQVRCGLRILKQSIQSFENFVAALEHDMYFVEPLYYHNAVIFERYGFRYQMGRRRMEWIHQGFLPGGVLLQRLDGSTPFRKPGAENSIRKRSWAIHDGILGEPFSNVTMYRRLGDSEFVETTPNVAW